MTIPNIKYKLLTFDELVINLDRLSRFKLPDYSYKRVFSSIITKYLISPKYSLQEIENLETKYICEIVKTIWNASIKKLSNFDNKSPIYALKEIIYNTFDNIDENTKNYIETDFILSPILEKLDYNTAPFNLKFLIKINEIFNNKDIITINKLKQLRNQFAFIYPIEKLLIVEGITEEILLPVFADKSNKNFDKSGIYVLGAGGKSKSPAIYQRIKNQLKIPIILLFDNDANEICNNLILNKKDKCFLIKQGEFEDIISKNLIKRTLNNEYEPATPLTINDLKSFDNMCDNIQNFYRTRHLGEYKKSKVAKLISQNVKYSTDITNEINEMLSFITNTCETT